MRTLIFQHTSQECPGTLVDWLKQKEFPFHAHHFYLEAKTPDLSAFDFLVVLGGPMNVDEEGKYPWLREEKKLVHHWLKSEKPILGICLGGQMLAQCLGAQVTKNTHKEIGFHQVHRTDASHPSLERWPDSFHVFQWHEDKFSLPAGCKSLLTNEACEHQAFSLNRKTVGLQFHPESTKHWIENNYQDFHEQAGPFVQRKDKCHELLAKHLDPMREQFFHFLDDFISF